MAQDAHELVRKVLKSEALKKSANLRKLLLYLEKHMRDEITADDIWEEVFEETEAETDGQRVRELAFRLRSALKDIAADSGNEEFLRMPDADEMQEDGKKGFRLLIGHRRQKRVTELFWKPHSMSDNVRLIYAEPIFYYDIISLGYFRYLDTDPETTRNDLAVKELEIRHGDELKKIFGDKLVERLRPTRVYMGIGDAQSLERLSGWFEKRALIKPTKTASDRVSGLQGSCPILIGSERTNVIIKSFLKSEDGQKFCYRSSPERIGHVDIRGATDQERKGMTGYDVFEKDGITLFGQAATISQVRDRPAVVTRMRMPGTKGTVTMVSSDSTVAIREVVFALTDDNITEGFVEASGWGPKDIPAEFEMLLSVRIAPAHFEHEGSIPKLIGTRSY
jgi:hypothetical protein